MVIARTKQSFRFVCMVFIWVKRYRTSADHTFQGHWGRSITVYVNDQIGCERLISPTKFNRDLSAAAIGLYAEQRLAETEDRAARRVAGVVALRPYVRRFTVSLARHLPRFCTVPHEPREAPMMQRGREKCYQLLLAVIPQ